VWVLPDVHASTVADLHESQEGSNQPPTADKPQSKEKGIRDVDSDWENNRSFSWKK